MHYGLKFPNQSLANARLGSIESVRLRETYGETVFLLHSGVSLYRLKAINANNDRNNYMIFYS